MKRALLAAAFAGSLGASAGSAQVDLPWARPEEWELASAPLASGVAEAVNVVGRDGISCAVGVGRGVVSRTGSRSACRT